MPKSPVDQEDFQAWLEHPVTRWVRQRFREQAQTSAEAQAASLLDLSPSRTALEWADLQGRAAHRKGLCDGFMQIAELDYAAVREETDEEIEAMEKAKQ